jgi:hypothetical protein
MEILSTSKFNNANKEMDISRIDNNFSFSKTLDKDSIFSKENMGIQSNVFNQSFPPKPFIQNQTSMQKLTPAQFDQDETNNSVFKYDEDKLSIIKPEIEKLARDQSLIIESQKSIIQNQYDIKSTLVDDAKTTSSIDNEITTLVKSLNKSDIKPNLSSIAQNQSSILENQSSILKIQKKLKNKITNESGTEGFTSFSSNRSMLALDTSFNDIIDEMPAAPFNTNKSSILKNHNSIIKNQSKIIENQELIKNSVIAKMEDSKIAMDQSTRFSDSKLDDTIRKISLIDFTPSISKSYDSSFNSWLSPNFDIKDDAHTSCNCNKPNLSQEKKCECKHNKNFINKIDMDKFDSSKDYHEHGKENMMLKAILRPEDYTNIHFPPTGWFSNNGGIPVSKNGMYSLATNVNGYAYSEFHFQQYMDISNYSSSVDSASSNYVRQSNGTIVGDCGICFIHTDQQTSSAFAADGNTGVADILRNPNGRGGGVSGTGADALTVASSLRSRAIFNDISATKYFNQIRPGPAKITIEFTGALNSNGGLLYVGISRDSLDPLTLFTGATPVLLNNGVLPDPKYSNVTNIQNLTDKIVTPLVNKVEVYFFPDDNTALEYKGENIALPTIVQRVHILITGASANTTVANVTVTTNFDAIPSEIFRNITSGTKGLIYYPPMEDCKKAADYIMDRRVVSKASSILTRFGFD